MRHNGFIGGVVIRLDGQQWRIGYIFSAARSTQVENTVAGLYEKTSCHNCDKFITEEIFTKELTITTFQNMQSKSFIKNAMLRGRAWFWRIVYGIVSTHPK